MIMTLFKCRFYARMYEVATTTLLLETCVKYLKELSMPMPYRLLCSDEFPIDLQSEACSMPQLL